MIVYGDAAFTEAADALHAHLRASLHAARQTPSLDRLRALLIRAGQFEQAVCDAPLEPAVCRQAAALSDYAAAAFWAVAQADQHAAGEHARHHLAAAAHILTTFAMPATPLLVKLPEGFAFYALFPEQYAAAAQRWLADHQNAVPRRAVVIGVRSIGTSLSALVAAVLEAGGWDVARATVRPFGHPFAREATLAGLALHADMWGLVVDEGPGMSGSSMAAAAAALQQASVRRERIAFLPGHGGEPGSAASDTVRGWWQHAPRYPATDSPPLFDGMPLPDALAAATMDLLPHAGSVANVEDGGGGLWRTFVYAEEADWPAACALFERPKYRVTLDNGEQIWWTFGGLAGAAGTSTSTAEAQAALLHERAVAGWSAPALGVAHGFVAQPWLCGTPLAHTDASPALAAHIGRYIAAVAGPPLAPAEQTAAISRAAELLYWNMWEALGESAAERTRPFADAAHAAAQNRSFPSYGDGRLAPYEWLRLADGSVQKTDSTGHSADHTVVGQQPVAWDLAGALVEWQFDDANAALMLRVFTEAIGTVSPALLAFYQLAYAAFRLGQLSMCGWASAHDPGEQARIWRAVEHYRAVLEDMTRVEGSGIRI